MYDAIQLAAALSCLETIEGLGADMVFTTFDRQLRDAAARAGLETWPK